MLDRRTFLKTTAAGAAAMALDGPAFGALAPARAKHVVLIALAGGVRSKETVESPQNVPNLMRMAGEGVVCPNVKAENLGHYGAALSIFTGAPEVFGIRESGRSLNPTVFEYVRQGLGLGANAVWLSTTNGNQQVNFAHGEHPRFGARYGANLIAADGVFNAEFKGILDQFGKPKLASPKEQDAMARLRGAVGAGEAAGGHAREVEQFILEEIGGKNTTLTGPGASDAKALRVATNILRVFRPSFLGVALQEADVAHNGFNAYVEIVRRNDGEIGRLLDAIQGDAELRDETAVFVLPEFGRDRDLNERNGLDHGDDSTELNRVAMVAWGKGIKSRRTIREPLATIDVAPTICHLFGVKAKYARGKVASALLA